MYIQAAAKPNAARPTILLEPVHVEESLLQVHLVPSQSDQFAKAGDLPPLGALAGLLVPVRWRSCTSAARSPFLSSPLMAVPVIAQR